MEKQDLDTDADMDTDTVDSTSYIKYTQGQLGKLLNYIMNPNHKNLPANFTYPFRLGEVDRTSISSGLVFSMVYTSLTMADQRGSASTMPPFFYMNKYHCIPALIAFYAYRPNDPYQIQQIDYPPLPPPPPPPPRILLSEWKSMQSSAYMLYMLAESDETGTCYVTV